MSKTVPLVPKLRAATIDDADDIGSLHARVWLSTYHRPVPSAAVIKLDAAYRQRQWRQLFQQQTADQIILVTEIEQAMVGMILGTPAQEAHFGDRAEVKYLYVDPAYARKGIGRRLLSRLAFVLRQRHHRAIGLGVVVGNDAAIVFYEALDGIQIGRYVDPGPIWRSDNLIYVWDDIDGLCSFTESDG
jgi:ribosomal protein S18 acetylase RimI-like enzyme